MIYFQNISHDTELSGAALKAIFSMKQKKELLSLVAIILTSIIFYYKYYKDNTIRKIANITLKMRYKANHSYDYYRYFSYSIIIHDYAILVRTRDGSK